jgi:hypothetical protein
MHLRPLVTALACLLLAAGGVGLHAGCGGEGETGEKAGEGSGAEAGEKAEEGGSEAQAEKAAEQVPAADRAAYYQLGISSGLLRAALVARSMGQPSPARAGEAELRRFAATVRRVHPDDRGLRSVRTAELAMLARVTPTDSLSAAHARAELRRLDRINASLSRFLRREPRGAALVPD